MIVGVSQSQRKAQRWPRSLAAAYPLNFIDFQDSSAVQLDQTRLAGRVDPSSALVAPDGTVTVAAPVVFPTVVDKGNTFEIKDILRNLARTDLTPRERAFYEASVARTAEWVGAFIAPQAVSS